MTPCTAPRRSRSGNVPRCDLLARWHDAQMPRSSSRRGPVALVGGGEFMPGNEVHDAVLVAAARASEPSGPAYVVATAAARQDPDAAVRTAVAWYAALGLTVEELPVRGRGQANAAAIAARARDGQFFVFAGGDPGLVVATLRDTVVWDAILEAWRGGAVLAGSSAG